jgi:hypothetical protein
MRIWLPGVGKEISKWVLIAPPPQIRSQTHCVIFLIEAKIRKSIARFTLPQQSTLSDLGYSHFESE